MSVTEPRGAAGGYSLVELLFVVGVMAVIAATAVPMIAATMRRYALNNAAQQVAAAIRSARYTAVSRNKIMRVRFDCPAADQFRIVEFTGVAATDDAADRCDEEVYPYPDVDTVNAPNLDGPVMTLPVGTELDSTTDLQISAQGRLQALAGCPSCTTAGNSATITLSNGSESQTVSIGQNGQVAVESMVEVD